MGTRKYPGTRLWQVIRRIPPSESGRTEEEWRALLAPLIANNNLPSFASSFSAAFNSAVTLPFFEAFFLYTDHVDSEYFANFIVALMLRGRDLFEACLQDPEELARRQLPTDLHYEAEGFLPAIVDVAKELGVELEHELDLEGCSNLSKALLDRIHRVDLKGKGGFRARRPELESEDAYRFRHRYAVFRSKLAKRWPALARE